MCSSTVRFRSWTLDDRATIFRPRLRPTKLPVSKFGGGMARERREIFKPQIPQWIVHTVVRRFTAVDHRGRDPGCRCASCRRGWPNVCRATEWIHLGLTTNRASPQPGERCSSALVAAYAPVAGFRLNRSGFGEALWSAPSLWSRVSGSHASTRATVGAPRVHVHVANQIREPGVAHRPRRGRSGPPGVVPRFRHVQNTGGPPAPVPSRRSSPRSPRTARLGASPPPPAAPRGAPPATRSPTR